MSTAEKTLNVVELEARLLTALGWRFWKEQRGSYVLCVFRRPGEPEPWKAYRVDAVDRERARFEEVSALDAWGIGFYGDRPPRYARDDTAALSLVATHRIALIPSEDGWYALRPYDIEHGCVRGTSFPRLGVVGEEHHELAPSETIAVGITRAVLAALGDAPAPSSPEMDPLSREAR